MQEEAHHTNGMGLFQALQSVSERLRCLAEVMHEMSGFAPGEKVTLNQDQVDILFRKPLIH